MAGHQANGQSGQQAVAEDSFMKRLVFPALVALSALFVAPQASAQNAAGPTFNKDVAPILFANCTNCHRPGDIGRSWHLVLH